jgi:hypothetical protein
VRCWLEASSDEFLLCNLFHVVERDCDCCFRKDCRLLLLLAWANVGRACRWISATDDDGEDEDDNGCSRESPEATIELRLQLGKAITSKNNHKLGQVFACMAINI